MHPKLRRFILAHERQFHRGLEILVGGFSWLTILLFFAGSFLFPFQLAYIVIFFDVFWFYKSITFAVSAIVSYFRIQASQVMDWLGEVKSFPDWRKVHHVVIIPQYKEPIHILERSVQSLVNQDFPLQQITVVMATEARDP